MKGEAAFDVVVIGAGPAGIAAAVSAAGCCGQRVAVVDDNSAAGGQIWRRGHGAGRLASTWLRRFHGSRSHCFLGYRVISADVCSRKIIAESDSDALQIRYGRLIIATGARERFLPFPGWTLPNVMAVGGLQSFVKGGLNVKGKRIVVAGAGPLLPAVASYLTRHGAVVALIAEQTSASRLARFGLGLVVHPSKLAQAAAFKSRIGAVPYRTDTWVRLAEGDGAEGNRKVQRVHLATPERSYSEACDYLAVSYGFVPNLELPAILGCRLESEGTWVDETQQTSVDGIFCAGEVTGIGGAALSLVEGAIAGYAASGAEAKARRLFPARQRERSFASLLDKTFSLRRELKGLPSDDTIVCRCEDVTYSSMRKMQGWRSAKLQTRCGMGACQGRVCGPAAQFLFGWKVDSVRAPILPARIETLIGQ